MGGIFVGSRCLVSSFESADSPLSHLIGLMGRQKPTAMLFRFKWSSRLGNSIHTFFMAFPIDAVWLDERMRAVDITLNIRPWRLLVVPKAAARNLLELPAGGAAGLKVGDKLEVR